MARRMEEAWLLLRNVVFIAAIYVHGTASQAFTDGDKKLVGTEKCLVTQFCHRDNAIAALISDFKMSSEEANNFYDLMGDTILTSCSCDDSCVFYNTCCQDKHSKSETSIPSHLAPLVTRLREDRNAYTCTALLKADIIVVNTCPDDAPNSMKERCETVLSLTEAKWELKVTSKRTHLTYKNVICGMCNGEKYDELVSWVWNFDCGESLGGNITTTTRSDSVSKSVRQMAADARCNLNETIPTVPPPDNDKSLGLYQTLKKYDMNIGVYVDSLNFCGSPPISSCPDRATEKLKEQCEKGPNAFVTIDAKVYKNEYCLQCHGVDPAMRASCEACEHPNCNHPEAKVTPNKLLNSFGVLVQSYPSEKMTYCKAMSPTDNCDGYFDNLQSCGYGSFLNYDTSECERICPDDSHLDEGQCVFTSMDLQCKEYRNYNKFVELEVTTNTSVKLDSKTYKHVGNGPTQCYNCSYLVNTTANEYITVGSDGTVYYNGKVVPENMVFRQGNNTFWVCLDQAHVVEEVITGVTLAISMVSLILYFCAFVLMRRLRNVPGKIVAGNMTCLFLAYVFFYLRNATDSFSAGCITFAILIHYFLLASFIFNIIYASFIVYSLEFIDFESSVNHWTAIRMWILGLLVPLTIIIPGFVLDFVPSNEFKPAYGGEQCFLMNEKGRYIFFIAPIGLCLLIAVILYLVILVKLIKIARATSQVRSNHKEKVAIAMKLVIVLGFCWLFAVAAAATRHPVMLTIFLITCCLQGFFSFVVFICNKATLRDLRRCCGRKYSSVVTKTPTSTASTASTDLSKNLLRQTESNVSTAGASRSNGADTSCSKL